MWNACGTTGVLIVKKNICRKLLLLLSGALIHCALHAQEMPDGIPAMASASSDTIRHSSVTAFSAKSVTPVHTLSGSTLQKMSSMSIADALRYFAGVQVKDYGGIGGLKTVNVRSLGAQHVGVFYDGVGITNAQNGQVDLGRYSLDNMEAISVYNSQKSEALQSANEYASGSTLYLKTRTPVFEGKDYNVLARIKAGSFGTVNPLVRYERKVGNVALSAEGMYLKTRGDYKFHLKSAVEDTVGRRSNGDVEAMRFEAGAWAHPWGGDLQAHAYFYKSERGLPGPVVRRLSEQYSSKDRQWDDNGFLQASYKKSFEKVSLLLNLKGFRDYLEYLSDPAQNSAAIFIHNDYDQGGVFGSAAVAWHPLDWISVNGALDGTWSGLDCSVKGFDHVDRMDSKVAAGMTISHDGFTFQASGVFTNVTDFKKGESATMRKVTPSVSACWRGGSGILTLRSFWKSSFRAPTLNDLYYTMVGNANLKPEHARQADLGFDLQSAKEWKVKSVLSVDGFYNKVTDKIVAMPTNSQFRWTMMNYGKVDGLGLNASLRSSVAIDDATVSSVLTYSYEEAREKTSPESISFNGQIPYTPWHSGSAVIGLDKGPWKANASILCTGARYRSADNTPENRLKPWTTTDLSLGREFHLRKGAMLELGLDICNVFNQHYEVVTRYPMPGTSALTRITLTL